MSNILRKLFGVTNKGENTLLLIVEFFQSQKYDS